MYQIYVCPSELWRGLYRYQGNPLFKLNLGIAQKRSFQALEEP